MECNKYKKKAILGVILFLFFPIIKAVDLVQYISLSILLIIGLIIFILGLKLMMPYAFCIQKLIDRKSPFSK